MSFTGSFGFVLTPNQSLANEAIHQARLWHKARLESPREAEYKVTTAHLTLFHANVHDVPEDFVQETLDALAAIVDQPLNFDAIEPYGGKFLFWHARRSQMLNLAHLAALHLSRYLDSQVPAQAVTERLPLSAEELENLAVFGHPLVRSRFLPHITLAYASQGTGFYRTSCPFKGCVATVSFAQIGEHGRVLEHVMCPTGAD